MTIDVDELIALYFHLGAKRRKKTLKPEKKHINGIFMTSTTTDNTEKRYSSHVLIRLFRIIKIYFFQS